MGFNCTGYFCVIPKICDPGCDCGCHSEIVLLNQITSLSENIRQSI
jgi:hypothetical protein